MFKKIWAKMNNWKTVLAWALLHVPGLSDYPGLVTSIQEFLANPSKQYAINLAWQLLFSGAIGHRILKNLR